MASRNVTVGTTPELLLPYNPRRTSVSIFNNDTAAVFVSEDQVGTLAEGFPITAGGAISLVGALGDEPQNQLFAISSAGGADVRVLEQFGKLPPLETPQGRIGSVGGGE